MAVYKKWKELSVEDKIEIIRFQTTENTHATTSIFFLVIILSTFSFLDGLVRLIAIIPCIFFLIAAGMFIEAHKNLEKSIEKIRGNVMETLKS